MGMVNIHLFFYHFYFMEDNPFGGASILDECKEVSGADLLRSIRLRKEKQLDINGDCEEDDDESNVFCFNI